MALDETSGSDSRLVRLRLLLQQTRKTTNYCKAHSTNGTARTVTRRKTTKNVRKKVTSGKSQTKATRTTIRLMRLNRLERESQSKHD